MDEKYLKLRAEVGLKVFCRSLGKERKTINLYLFSIRQGSTDI